MQVVVRDGSWYLLYLLFCDSGHLKRVVAWVGFEVCAAGFACWAVSFGARGGAEQDRSRIHCWLNFEIEGCGRTLLQLGSMSNDVNGCAVVAIVGSRPWVKVASYLAQLAQAQIVSMIVQ